MRLLNLRPIAGQQMLAPPLGSCATMMFLGSLPNSDVSDNRVNWLCDLAVRPPLREALLAHREPNTVRDLVVAWVIKCPNRDEQALNDRLRLMFIYGLPEAISLPAAIAHCESEYLTVSPILRASAALAVSRFGTKADAAKLELLLEDESIVRRPAKRPAGRRRQRACQRRGARRDAPFDRPRAEGLWLHPNSTESANCFRPHFIGPRQPGPANRRDRQMAGLESGSSGRRPAATISGSLPVVAAKSSPGGNSFGRYPRFLAARKPAVFAGFSAVGQLSWNGGGFVLPHRRDVLAGTRRGRSARSTRPCHSPIHTPATPPLVGRRI